MSAFQEIAIDIEADRAGQGPDTFGQKPGALSGLWARLNGYSIGRKISLFFGLNLAVALIAGFVVLVSFIQISNHTQQTTDSHRSAFVAERLITELLDAQLHSESLASTGDASHGDGVLGKLDAALVSLEELQGLAKNKAGRHSQNIADISGEVGKSRADFTRVLQDPDRANSMANSVDFVAVQPSTIEAARDLAAQLELAAGKMATDSRMLITTVLSFWIGITGALILLTLIAQRYFDRHVGAALSQLSSHMQRLSLGEKVPEIEANDRQDEIGEMTRAVTVFHRAGIRLERMNRERSKKAKEELEEQARLQQQKEENRLDRERTLRRIADKLELNVGDVVDKVANASSQLQSTATTMASSAEQASTRTNEVTVHMQEANAGSTAAAAASDEFAMSIGEVSRQAAASAELARKASESTHEADATIAKLSESAGQVGHIVELIQTIAQRTNLLALNASIEAARGGESGRGFAVVASEVKELAMQTSRATEEVALQIREMQDTTGASVSALRSIANEVTELENFAVSIASAVDQQSYAGQDLARSIDMAANGTEQVAEHIQEVQQLSTSTGEAAGQVLSSATALDQQAATLRNQVNSFLEEIRGG